MSNILSPNVKAIQVTSWTNVIDATEHEQVYLKILIVIYHPSKGNNWCVFCCFFLLSRASDPSDDFLGSESGPVAGSEHLSEIILTGALASRRGPETRARYCHNRQTTSLTAYQLKVSLFSNVLQNTIVPVNFKSSIRYFCVKFCSPFAC